MNLDEHLALLHAIAKPFSKMLRCDPEDLIDEAWLVTRNDTDRPLIITKAKRRFIDILRYETRRYTEKPKELEIECDSEESNDTMRLDVATLIDSSNLTPNERTILFQRFYLGHTLRKVAELNKTNKSAVLRTQREALEKIRRHHNGSRRSRT